MAWDTSINHKMITFGEFDTKYGTQETPTQGSSYLVKYNSTLFNGTNFSVTNDFKTAYTKYASMYLPADAITTSSGRLNFYWYVSTSNTSVVAPYSAVTSGNVLADNRKTTSSDVVTTSYTDASGTSRSTFVAIWNKPISGTLQSGFMYSRSTLKYVDFTASGGGRITGIGNNVFRACRELEHINWNNNLYMSDITSIGSYAFSGCTKIDVQSCLTFSFSVSAIPIYYCASCTSLWQRNKNSGTVFGTLLKDIHVFNSYCFKGACIQSPLYLNASNVSSIGTQAFAGTEITELGIIRTSKTIGGFTSISQFTDKDVNYGYTLTISSAAFSGCTSLTKVYLGYSNVVTVSSNSFAGCTNLSAIYVPNSLLSSYKSNSAWTAVATNLGKTTSTLFQSLLSDS